MSFCIEEGEEYDIGESQCPCCGGPILTKFQEGRFMERYDCPICSGGSSSD